MMRRFPTATLAAAMVLGGALAAQAETVTVPMTSVGLATTDGSSVGDILASETASGVRFKLALERMPIGSNWVLLTESAACPTDTSGIEGKALDLIDTGDTLPGPQANGASFDAPDMKLADLRNRALIVFHDRPDDNVSQYREIQVACGVVK